MKAVLWSAEEEETLFGMVGDLPWSVVTRVYNQWAVASGYPRRTFRAQRRRVQVAGYSLKATGTWLDIPTIARLLGISGETVRRWTREKTLNSYHEGVKIYVKRDSLRALARQRPEFFCGRSRDDLYMLLDDERLADDLSSRPLGARTGRRTPVQCVETGRIYGSYNDAAQAVFVTRQAITRAVCRGRQSAGWHWRRVDLSRYQMQQPRKASSRGRC